MSYESKRHKISNNDLYLIFHEVHTHDIGTSNLFNWS